MAIIQSGTDNNLLRVNAAGQALTTDSLRNRMGLYIAHSGLMSAQATAHATTAGFMWLLNPASSSRLVALRRAEVASSAVAAAAVVTRVTLERMSFTGTPGATPLTVAKVDTADANASATLVTASTGITPTTGPALYGFQLAAVITAAGVVVPVKLEWQPGEAGMPVLRPGEGLVFRQPDAGVATDPRRFTINLAWEEFTTL